MKQKRLTDSTIPEASLLQNLGGKAYNLLKMQKAGFAVPPFFVLPGEQTEKILAPFKSEIDSFLRNAMEKSEIELAEFSILLQKKIKGIDFPTILEKEIKQNCQKIFGDNYLVSVRSSASNEDSNDISFAGQYESFLFVDEGNLIPKILECIASGFNVGLLSYKRHHAVMQKENKFAVIIQQMINAEKSGIGFSMNINENLADMIVVAGYGLGQGIVNDQVESDTFIINRLNKSVEKRIARKETALLYTRETGLQYVSVPEDKRDRAILNQDEIQQISEYLMNSEILLGKPSDIEFSIDQEGNLFILQMRPVTTLNTKDIKILDNTNIVESYPGITSTLSFSFALNAYEKVFRSSYRAFRIPEKVIRQQSHIFENLLANFQGRIYYRLDNWYQMMSLVHSSKKSIRAWEKAVGLSVSESDRVLTSLRSKFRTMLSLFWLLLNYRRGNKRFFRQFNTSYNRLINYNDKLSSAKSLWIHFEETTNELFRPWYLTIVNDFLAFKSFGWLQNLIKSYKIANTDELANDLISESEGVESVNVMLYALKIKGQIASNPVYSELFMKDPHEVLILLKSEQYIKLQQEIHRYLENYGDRTLAELKLETESLRQNPELFIGMLKNLISSPLTLEKFLENKKSQTTEATKQVKAILSWWNPKFYVFALIRKLATYGLKNRENMRFCRSRAYGAVKDIFREIGGIMVADGAINEPDDIFYLEVKNLEDFCLQNKSKNLTELINSRKITFREYTEFNLPDRIMYTGNEAPQFNKELLFESNNNNFQGIAISRGIVVAQAVILTEPKLDADVRGKILVTRMTDPGWVFLMAQSAGLISEKGSLLSHTAIVGRELGIPVVVGIQHATSIFKDGDLLILDGNLGSVSLKAS